MEDELRGLKELLEAREKDTMKEASLRQLQKDMDEIQAKVRWVAGTLGEIREMISTKGELRLWKGNFQTRSCILTVRLWQSEIAIGSAVSGIFQKTTSCA